MPINRVLPAHIFYAWYVYHCPSFHDLGIVAEGLPFMVNLANGRRKSMSAREARRLIRGYKDVMLGRIRIPQQPANVRFNLVEDLGRLIDSTANRSGR